MMHDGVPCGPIQGQGQGHMALKVRNSSIFKIYLVRHFQLELAYLNVIGRIFDVCHSFYVV